MKYDAYNACLLKMEFEQKINQQECIRSKAHGSLHDRNQNRIYLQFDSGMALAFRWPY